MHNNNNNNNNINNNGIGIKSLSAFYLAHKNVNNKSSKKAPPCLSCGIEILSWRDCRLSAEWLKLPWLPKTDSSKPGTS